MTAIPVSRYALAADGYFTRDGQRFIPVGANWWPGSCGVELWQQWPADEIRHDLDLLAGLGLNCLRFFLRWQDFEPEAGVYDRRQWDRLEQLLGWCRERNIAAHPTLFVGFMSGGVFWTTWKGERNVFGDPGMRVRAVEFTRAATAVIARHADTVLAIDQGNELCCLRESQVVPPATIASWCADISAAVKAVAPQMLVISGNEQNQVVNDTGWRFDAQPGTDLYSMHGYPVTGWHSLPFDGMTDPLCQGLLPFYVRCARAFGPVMLQEFGTIATFGPAQQRAYLAQLLPAAWAAGANGFLWWCLRDITADIHPYRRVGMESTLGLLDDSGAVKPGLEGFIAFARGLATAPLPIPASDSVGIYWPTEFYDRENPRNPGNVPAQLSRRMLIADHLLRQLGQSVAVVRGGCAIPPGVKTVLVTGALLCQDEWRTLHAWVESGGRLIIDGIGAMTLGRDAIAVLGWVPVDYRAGTTCRIAAFGDQWECASFGQGLRLEVEPRTADIAFRDESDRPAILVHALGRGRVVCSLPVMGDSIAAVAERRADRDRYGAWYRGLLDLASG